MTTAICFLWGAMLSMAPADAPEAVWQDFQAWFNRSGVPSGPAEVIKQYAAHLSASGMAEPDVKARVAQVEQLVRERPQDALKLHFNRIYTWADAPIRKEPSAFMMRIAKDMKPGKALDVAMGQGRNSLWLASQGWTVTGYDMATEGMRQAREAAASKGLALKTVEATHETFDFGRDQWDLIVMAFAFVPLGNEGMLNKIRDSLKVDGVLIVEGFNGPTPGFRSPANLVLKPFLNWRVLAYEDLPDIPDWGRQPAQLCRLAVRREQ